MTDHKASERVFIGDSRRAIRTRGLTLLLPSANMAMHNIEYPDRIPVDAVAIKYHADRVDKLHPEFDKYYRLFMKSVSDPHDTDTIPTPAQFRQMGTGLLHLMGLIDLALKMQDKNVPVVWKYPETSLHPGYQAGLGDLFVAFMRRGEELDNGDNISDNVSGCARL